MAKTYKTYLPEQDLLLPPSLRDWLPENQPVFRTISDFRKLHLKTLEELFQQVLRLVLEMGALKLGRVALDGSKVKANASKHKAMSYGRMEETEKRLQKRINDTAGSARVRNSPKSYSDGKRG